MFTISDSNSYGSQPPSPVKKTVFGQYTRAGESINELEETEQKKKIDLMMGRSATAENSPLLSEKKKHGEGATGILKQ